MDSESQKLTCGLVMPISQIGNYTEQHWSEVLLLIREALADTDFSVDLVSNANDVGVIQTRIVQNLYWSDIVVCDVSAKNPNVMFELGMRLAFDRPAIIIKDDATSYSFDTAPIEHLTYPSDLRYGSIQTFKQKLREKVVATHASAKNPNYTTFLKHFGKFVVAEIETKPVSKEDFIVEEIGALRSEVRGLTMAMLQRIFVQTPTEPPTNRKSITEGEFVSQYLSSDTAPPISELRSFTGESFAKLVAAYEVAAFEAPGMKADEPTRRRLLAAVNLAKAKRLE